MLAYLLAAVGGYLIGDSVKGYENGGVVDGKEIVEMAKRVGTSGGFSDWTLRRIGNEDYEISIDDLRKDKYLYEYLTASEKKGKIKIRRYRVSVEKMLPIVESNGEVIDGWNRIAQAINDGKKDIKVYYGIKK
jgi:hypothetical protein